ncbi:MAG: DNA translocase FtsK 4TM domain-containing protein, partial [Deltaproteobacteria bacterium]|nr:DNA translocase FtsK 4TM domain-containing protein [Deltaproteobacteria bacterium]
MRKEIRGIILLFVAVVLGVSLFSYHPDDPLFWQKAGISLLKARNLFGPVGAHIAGGIFLLLGFSSFWLVLLFLALAILSFL